MKKPVYIFLLFIFFILNELTPFFYGEAVAQATKVVINVNDNAITNYDISQRVAWLRLQGREGNLTKLAREELINEMVHRIEFKKRNLEIKEEYVDASLADFIQRNNLTLPEWSEILHHAGVSLGHFRSFIRGQIGWSNYVQARFQDEERVSPEEAVQRMLKNGGVKPKIAEYNLKQVILVIPPKRRAAIFNKRTQEANLLRSRIKGCTQLRQQIKGMIDVTIRDLGRYLEPTLPGVWAPLVKATEVGKTTPAQPTPNGIEFLVLCSKRQVSDDRVAQLAFSIQDRHANHHKLEKAAEKYNKELRSKARIRYF